MLLMSDLKGCFLLLDRAHSPVRCRAVNEACCLGGSVAERLRGAYARDLQSRGLFLPVS